MKYFIGIDSGLMGASCLIDENKKVISIKSAPKNKSSKEFDGVVFYQILKSYLEQCKKLSENFEVIVAIEDPTINPLFGKSQLYSFGKYFGIVLGCCSALFNDNQDIVKKIERFSPKKWQKLYLQKGEKTSKEKSVEKALEIFGPNESLPLTLHQGKRADRAEALLIANYSREENLKTKVEVPNKKTIKKKPVKRRSSNSKTKLAPKVSPTLLSNV